MGCAGTTAFVAALCERRRFLLPQCSTTVHQMRACRCKRYASLRLNVTLFVRACRTGLNSEGRVCVSYHGVERSVRPTQNHRNKNMGRANRFQAAVFASSHAMAKQNLLAQSGADLASDQVADPLRPRFEQCFIGSFEQEPCFRFGT